MHLRPRRVLLRRRCKGVGSGVAPSGERIRERPPCASEGGAVRSRGGLKAAAVAERRKRRSSATSTAAKRVVIAMNTSRTTASSLERAPRRRLRVSSLRRPMRLLLHGRRRRCCRGKGVVAGGREGIESAVGGPARRQRREGVICRIKGVRLPSRARRCPPMCRCARHGIEGGAEVIVVRRQPGRALGAKRRSRAASTMRHAFSAQVRPARGGRGVEGRHRGDGHAE